MNVKKSYGEVWDPFPDGRSNRKREQQAECIVCYMCICCSSISCRFLLFNNLICHFFLTSQLHSLDSIFHFKFPPNAKPSTRFIWFPIGSGEGVLKQPNEFDCGIYVIKFMETPGLIPNKSYMVAIKNFNRDILTLVSLLYWSIRTTYSKIFFCIAWFPRCSWKTSSSRLGL